MRILENVRVGGGGVIRNGVRNPGMAVLFCENVRVGRGGGGRVDHV